MSELILYSLLLFSYTASSDNGLFCADICYGGGIEFYVESFILYNQDYEVIYIKEKPVANTFFIGNSGVVFALNERQLYLYGPDGAEKLLKDLNYPNGFGFSQDNSHFFASDKDGIFVYKLKGELIYKLSPGRLFISTEKARMIATISTDSLFLYKDGALQFIRCLSTPYTRSLYFSDDEKYITIEELGKIEVFDCHMGKRIEKE